MFSRLQFLVSRFSTCSTGFWKSPKGVHVQKSFIASLNLFSYKLIRVTVFVYENSGSCFVKVSIYTQIT